MAAMAAAVEVERIERVDAETAAGTMAEVDAAVAASLERVGMPLQSAVAPRQPAGRPELAAEAGRIRCHCWKRLLLRTAHVMSDRTWSDEAADAAAAWLLARSGALLQRSDESGTGPHERKRGGSSERARSLNST